LHAGPDIDALVKRFHLQGHPDDQNAKIWPGPAAKVSPMAHLSGVWSSRWNMENEPETWHEGTASIVAHEGYFALLHTDPQHAYLMIGKEVEGNLLAGRHYNVENIHDSAPWAGKIVGRSRIDGLWRGGRWDLRRADENAAGAS
jgi:hypothetical protein